MEITERVITFLMKRFIRYNDYKNDAISVNNPGNSISSRLDLLETDQLMEKLHLWLLFHKKLPIFKVDIPLINSQYSVELQHLLVLIGTTKKHSISHGLNEVKEQKID